MFLNDLSDQQKKMFMALAKRLVLADWRLEPHEQEAVERVEAELGHSLDVDPRDLMSNDNLALLDTPRVARIVLYELMVLAQADLKIDDSERHVFNDLAEELSIPDSVMAQLEKLSLDGFSIIRVNGDETDQKVAVNAVLAG